MGVSRVLCTQTKPRLCCYPAPHCEGPRQLASDPCQRAAGGRAVWDPWDVNLWVYEPVIHLQGHEWALPPPAGALFRQALRPPSPLPCRSLTRPQAGSCHLGGHEPGQVLDLGFSAC